jgi:hypothetical protein
MKKFKKIVERSKLVLIGIYFNSVAKADDSVRLVFYETQAYQRLQ